MASIVRRPSGLYRAKAVMSFGERVIAYGRTHTDALNKLFAKLASYAPLV